MKRDWDIIRDILLKLEESPTAQSFIGPKHFPQHDEQLVAYNMHLLNEGGYLQGKFIWSSSGDGSIHSAIVTRLTNAGHELLNTIRSETVWSRTKETFKTKGLDMTFDLVMAVGKKIMEAMLG